MIQIPHRPGRILNAVRHPVLAASVATAKRKHRKQFPACALCGFKGSFWSRNADVHHVIPVHVSPGLACDPRNLQSYCRLHHFIVGHLCNWRDWNKALPRTLQVYRTGFLRISKELPAGTRRDVRTALALLSGQRERKV